MAGSRLPGVLSHVLLGVAPARTPGPLGINDQADPTTLSCFGDTPGPTGISDHGDPLLASSLTRLLDLNKVQAKPYHRPLSKYNKLAKNGRFGFFYYRDIAHSNDARIEVDPEWVRENIVKMRLPANLRSLPTFGGIQYLRVNKHVLRNWERVFKIISEDVALLELIDSLDPGTFYPRHIRKNAKKGISNHSWGTAIDINPADHPLHSHVNDTDTEDANLKLYLRVFKPAGFTWGNSYDDPMHYEILKF